MSRFRNHGFSIIELMVVVAVIGLLVMAALPSFGRWIGNVQIRNAAESIQNGLRLAQLEAARRNGTVTLLLTAATAPTCSSTASTSGQNWIVCDGSSVIQTYYGNSTTTAIDSDFGSISFDGIGRSNLTAASVVDVKSSNSSCETLSVSGARCLQILVSPGGKVRMCDPLLSAGNPGACS